MARSHRTYRSAGARRGLTLMEMLVATVVLVVMVAAFGQILNQAQRVVTVSQWTMRSNNQAEAIAKVIRNDIRRISKNGFLYINDSGTALVFTITGEAKSLTSSATGTGEVVVLGLCDNTANDPDVLLRRGLVLYGELDPARPPIGAWDITYDDMADIQTKTAPDMQNYAEKLLDDLDELTIPPNDMTDIQELWQCLAPEAANLSIRLTFGKTITGEKNLDWIDVSDITYGRERIWTHHDQNGWPVALKIRFTLTDETLPEDLQNKPYEVICPVGQ